MQINRLDFRVLPPVLPSAVDASVSSADGDADAAQAAGARASAARNGAPVVTQVVAPAPADTPPSAAPATPGVTVALSGNTTPDPSSATYSANGLMSDRPRLVVDQTPAERFVASAVNIIRAYEESKANGADSPQAGANGAGGLLGGLRQAVSKLHLFA